VLTYAYSAASVKH